jgi:putative hydrolase of the HAD superfamily
VAVRAVFFDAGETLVHPHPSFADLFAEVLSREGHPVRASVVSERVTIIADRFQQAARDEELWTTTPERSRAFWWSVYRAFLAELGIAASEPLLVALYREFTDLANYRLFEDVPPVLDALAAHGVALGVVSNFEEWLERLLEELGVAAAFDVRVISGLEGLEKPDPRIFRLALDRAGVRPDESVYVGDSPAFDVEPARAVGMLPVLIDRRDRHPAFSSARIRDMSELPSAIGLVDGKPVARGGAVEPSAS